MPEYVVVQKCHGKISARRPKFFNKNSADALAKELVNHNPMCEIEIYEYREVLIETLVGTDLAKLRTDPNLCQNPECLHDRARHLMTSGPQRDRESGCATCNCMKFIGVRAVTPKVGL